MISNQSKNYQSVKTIKDLRQIVQDTEHWPDETTIHISHTEHDRYQGSYEYSISVTGLSTNHADSGRN